MQPGRQRAPVAGDDLGDAGDLFKEVWKLGEEVKWSCSGSQSRKPIYEGDVPECRQRLWGSVGVMLESLEARRAWVKVVEGPD